MNSPPRKISLREWDAHHARLLKEGLVEPHYGGPLSRHVNCRQDLRLESLRFDNSPAALRLWNLLLTEEDRLRAHRAQGRKLVGAMKDLGTVPIMAYSLPNLIAFYPDGAWWTPCLMELSDGLLGVANQLGVGESFCPVRAMLSAFVTQAHFPLPDLLICSVGAVCDDFSAIAQRLAGLGHEVHWWEMPRRRRPEPWEKAVELPGGLLAPATQVSLVRAELERIRGLLEQLSRLALDEPALAAGIRAANHIRRQLRQLRQLVFSAAVPPLPALELLIAEMLAIHYCSDREETSAVLGELLAEVRRRVAGQQDDLATGDTPSTATFDEASEWQVQAINPDSPLPPAPETARWPSQDAVRVFWINPVADLRAMLLLEECGGRLCGTDFMFTHALVDIPEDLPPLEALARVALADPMVGPAQDRAHQALQAIAALNAEAIVVSRIPGASHCPREGSVIRECVQAQAGIPVLEIEVPPICDAILPTLRSRLQALMETAIALRKR